MTITNHSACRRVRVSNELLLGKACIKGSTTFNNDKLGFGYTTDYWGNLEEVLQAGDEGFWGSRLWWFQLDCRIIGLPFC